MRWCERQALRSGQRSHTAYLLMCKDWASVKGEYAGHWNVMEVEREAFNSLQRHDHSPSTRILWHAARSSGLSTTWTRTDMAAIDQSASGR